MVSQIAAIDCQLHLNKDAYEASYKAFLACLEYLGIILIIHSTSMMITALAWSQGMHMLSWFWYFWPEVTTLLIVPHAWCHDIQKMADVQMAFFRRLCCLKRIVIPAIILRELAEQPLKFQQTAVPQGMCCHSTVHQSFWDHQGQTYWYAKNKVLK